MQGVSLAFNCDIAKDAMPNKKRYAELENLISTIFQLQFEALNRYLDEVLSHQSFLLFYQRVNNAECLL
jgi:hypothetical protein